VRDRLSELGDETEVAVVTFTARENLADYRLSNDLPFPLLSDPDRGTYRAFGLGRGSIARVYGWRMAKRYWEILRRNGPSGLARPSEDTLQLGGDFVIAPDGTLIYGYWGEGPDDRPPVDELVDAVKDHPST
jgi:hypothetical protein